MTGIDNQMMFENLRDSVETLLETYETGRFRVVTEQKQSTDAKEHKGLSRSVQIFFESGDFPDNTSSKREQTHEVTFQIEYVVSSASKVDLSVLNYPDSTDADVAAALSAGQSAAYIANRSIDELHRMVFQILLDPVNSQLGLPELDKDGDPITNPLLQGAKQVSQVRLVNFRKNEPIAKGSLFQLTASEQLTCQVQETTAGATPIAVKEPGIEINNEFNTKTDAEDANPATAEIDINTA